MTFVVWWCQETGQFLDISEDFMEQKQIDKVKEAMQIEYLFVVVLVEFITINLCVENRETVMFQLGIP